MATRPDQLYEDDFHAWTRHQARALRRLKALPLNTDLDLDHLAEEVRDLGREQVFAIQSQCERLIQHLLKLQHSRHDQPRRQWMHSVNRTRREITRRLTATLRKRLLAALPQLYANAAPMPCSRWRTTEAEAALPRWRPPFPTRWTSSSTWTGCPHRRACWASDCTRAEKAWRGHD